MTVVWYSFETDQLGAINGHVRLRRVYLRVRFRKSSLHLQRPAGKASVSAAGHPSPTAGGVHHCHSTAPHNHKHRAPCSVLRILTYPHLVATSSTPNESHIGTVQVGAFGPCQQTTAPHNIVAHFAC